MTVSHLVTWFWCVVGTEQVCSPLLLYHECKYWHSTKRKGLRRSPKRFFVTLKRSMEHTLRTTNLIQPLHFLHEEHEARKGYVISQTFPPQHIHVYSHLGLEFRGQRSWFPFIQLLKRLRQEHSLSPEVQVQPRQHREILNPFKKKKKKVLASKLQKEDVSIKREGTNEKATYGLEETTCNTQLTKDLCSKYIKKLYNSVTQSNPIFKRDKRHTDTKAVIQMAKRHIKRCWISLVIKEKLFKTTVR